MAHVEQRENDSNLVALSNNQNKAQIAVNYCIAVTLVQCFLPIGKEALSENYSETSWITVFTLELDGLNISHSRHGWMISKTDPDSNSSILKFTLFDSLETFHILSALNTSDQTLYFLSRASK